jgi:virginiamycin B lyase
MTLTLALAGAPVQAQAPATAPAHAANGAALPAPDASGVPAPPTRADPVTVIALDGSALPQGLAAAGGEVPTVWFSAAARSAVGEIDVASRTVGYIALGHGAKPRGLTRCPNGRLYVLDPALNVIHEVDPATEQVSRHSMPNGEIADLSGAVCTSGNLVVFTGYNGWVGKLDTATGKVTLLESQAGRGPAQMAMGPNGLIWFASYAANQVVRLDPESLKQDAFAMPSGVEGPKGIVVDSSSRVWVSAFRSGRIARLDPRRKSWDAWRLGPGSRPHAVALDAGGAVLVTDIGRDRLLRFDPATGSAAAVAPLSERGQARAMTRLGDQIWITETAADRVLLVDMAAQPSH